ncbi:MAG: hypothetical protein KDE19_02415 [Caldilineaceae bacterium]|nr:hypothetical protein [Caldilineaceae bacterium]
MHYPKRLFALSTIILSLLIVLAGQIAFLGVDPAYADEEGIDTADAINSNELLVFDENRNITLSDRGFPRNDPPRNQANGNWNSPINYAEGTLYYRVQIRSQPQPQNMRLQFCVWQDRFYLENCGSLADVRGTSGTVVTWSQSVQDMWRLGGRSIDWSRARQRYGFAIKNAQGQPVSDYNGWNWNGENPNQWYPLDARLTVVVVEKGGTFSGWQNYVGGGSNPTPTPRPTNTPNAPTPTNTPSSPNPTATPTPVTPRDGESTIYLSSSTGGRVNGIAFRDEDIMGHDLQSGSWWTVFDGSDVGLKVDVNGFAFLSDGSILMTVNVPVAIPGLGTVDDSDIVRFIPSSLGSTTRGSFELYFDGSDVGLDANGEDIDSISVLPDGRILVSTLGSIKVNGVSGADEDLTAFTPTSLGNNTQGSWAPYFDGSDVQLTTGYEDVWGAQADGNRIYLSVRGAYNVNGASGDGDDIFACNSASTGANTSCQFSVFWNGDSRGYGNEVIDGIHIGSGPQVTVSAADAEDVDEGEELYDDLDDDILEDENGEEVEITSTIYLPLLTR